MEVPDIDVLEMAGIYRKRIENLFSNSKDASAPTLQKYLEDWLAEIRGPDAEMKSEEGTNNRSANDGGSIQNSNSADNDDSVMNGARGGGGRDSILSRRSSVGSDMDMSTSRRGSETAHSTATTRRSSSIKWEPPAKPDNCYPPSPPSSPQAPPPPPTESEFHSESLPEAVADIMVEQDDTLQKDDILDELSYMTTRDYDLENTLDSVKDFLTSKRFSMRELDPCSYDRWKILRQPQGYFLLVLRLFLKDRSANVHYYKHHAMAYHKRILMDHVTNTFQVVSKDISSADRAERVFDSYFNSGSFLDTNAKYRHSALVKAYEIRRSSSSSGSGSGSSKRKHNGDDHHHHDEDMMSVSERAAAKRARASSDADGAAAEHGDSRRWTPITGEFTSIPDAIVLILKNMDIKADDIPKTLNHDYWLESVKKYVRMPITRYLNTKLLKPVSLQQQSVNNHLNILRERTGNHLVVMTIHFEDDKHGPVPKLTHGMVWLADDRLLFDHNTVDKPIYVTDRDLRTIGTAKKVFDTILRPLGRRSRHYKFCSVRSAYRIKHMTADDIEEMEEARALKAAAAVAASSNKEQQQQQPQQQESTPTDK